MFSSTESLNVLLAGAAAAGALCWIVVVVHRLSLSDHAQRQFLLLPVLLALAAFLPSTAGYVSGAASRITEVAGAPTTFELGRMTVVSWGLSGLYMFGVATLLLMSPQPGRTSPLNRSIFVLTFLYWGVGLLADLYAGFAVARLSFFLIPVLLIVAWRLRPAYRDTIAVLTYVSIAVCVASVLLALAVPSVAFTEPTRSATFLVSHRLAGITEHPNVLGLFASVGLILAWRTRGWTRLIGSPICAWVLIATDSRTAWFACAAAVCLLVAGGAISRDRPTADSNQANATWIPFRLLLGGSLVVFAALAILAYAVPEGQVNGFTGRTALWDFILQNWTSAPIIGHGPDIGNIAVIGGTTFGNGQNQLFDTLFTRGGLGLLLLVALLFAWTLKSARAARQGFWLPLALEGLVIGYGALEVPLNMSGIDPNIWLLSILLFLDPVEDTVAAPATQPRQVPSRRAGALAHV